MNTSNTNETTSASADEKLEVTHDVSEGPRSRNRSRRGHSDRHGASKRRDDRRHERGGRGRRRRGRGDIRSALLLLIAEQPRHGYELMQAIDERTDGQWRPSPGSVYPALQQLQDEGLVTVTADEHNRGIAALTDAGADYVSTNEPQLTEVWESVASSGAGSRVQMRNAVHNLVVALKQVQAVGTSEQVVAAQEVVDSARRNVYAILASEPTESATR